MGPVEGSINQIAALHDFKIFKELFDYDFQNLGESTWTQTDSAMIFGIIRSVNGHWTRFLMSRIRDRICDLGRDTWMKRKDAEEFKADSDTVLQRIWRW